MGRMKFNRFPYSIHFMIILPKEKLFHSGNDNAVTIQGYGFNHFSPFSSKVSIMECSPEVNWTVFNVHIPSCPFPAPNRKVNIAR